MSKLDKIEMVDSPLDDHEYEHRLKKLQNQLLDLQVEHLRPAAGSSSASTAGMPPARAA